MIDATGPARGSKWMRTNSVGYDRGYLRYPSGAPGAVAGSWRIERPAWRRRSLTGRASRVRKKEGSIDPPGYDAGKKRHLLLDTEGLLLLTIIHAPIHPGSKNSPEAFWAKLGYHSSCHPFRRAHRRHLKIKNTVRVRNTLSAILSLKTDPAR